MGAPRPSLAASSGFSVASKKRRMARSALDTAVHERGAQLLEQAIWHPVGRTGLHENEIWKEEYGEEIRRATIGMASDALDYKRLRGEHEMEQLTNRFAQMSLAEATRFGQKIEGTASVIRSIPSRMCPTCWLHL